MELQTLINNYSDYLSIFKENNLKCKFFKKKYCLVTYKYEEGLTYHNENNYWKMYCRGAVIDIINHKVVCVPPVKADEIKSIEEISNVENLNNRDIEYQSLIDGTMINLWYHNEQWNLSTRSDIGGYNKWDQKLSFKDMFEQCCQFNYELLDKQLCYSFVMRHISNRNISPICMNETYIVEVVDMTTYNRLRVEEYPNFLLVNDNLNEEVIYNNYENNEVPYYYKGYTIKIGNKRYKYINPEFIKAREIKGNTNNVYLRYLELRQLGLIQQYIDIFPEHNYLFKKYKQELHKLSNDLFTTYKQKNIYKQDIQLSYSLKPLLTDIHNIYKQNMKPITWNDIKNYIYNLPPKKLLFALNYHN